MLQGQSHSGGKVFVATEEWQEIQEGQAIPRGLHIRINMQTGKKEAKLLDKSEQQSSTAVAVYTAPESTDDVSVKKE